MNDATEHEERIRQSLAEWTASAELSVPSPDFIRARGTGRMRRKRAATAVAAVAAVAALTLGVIQIGQSESRPSHGTTALVQLVAHVGRVHLPAAAAETTAAAHADTELMTGVTRALLGSSGTNNVLVSPSSLAEVLTQLELGARGATATQIADALGENGVPATQQATDWNLLSQKLAADAKSSGDVLQESNGLFLENTLSVKPAFLNALASNFGEGIWRADFRDDPAKAAAQISNWAGHVTHFNIPSLLSNGSVNNRTAFVVANALRFSAKWSANYRFSITKTTQAVFHLANGTKSTVAMMHLTNDLKATTSHGVTAVELPYAGNRFSALVVEPTRGSLTSMVSSLTPGRITSIVKGLQLTTVTLSLPRFTLRASTSCDSALRTLDINDAFGSEADFGGITNTQVALSQVSQSQEISVSESGTDAGTASTVVGDVIRAERRQIAADFDHPFLFLIRDNSTGAVLFEAVVANPGPST